MRVFIEDFSGGDDMITYEDKSFDTWEDVVKLYPAMWVVFDKAELKHGKVVEGNIMAILPDEEVISFRHIHHNEIKLALRTTESVRFTDDNGYVIGYGTVGMGGYIHGELIDA